MHILLTSGGTKVPIDRVRSITNMSRGTFPAKIAYEMMMAGHRVARPNGRRSVIDRLSFLYARDSRRPFDLHVDIYHPDYDLKETMSQLIALDNDYHLAGKGIISQEWFRDFDGYRESLFRLLHPLSWGPVDLVVLAAAVSDYLVANYVDGKIRSSEELNIALTPAEKLIGSVKQKCPNCRLVGFKLMVDSTDDQLIDAAKQSISDNGCDLVVANDLRDIQNDNHRVHLVTEDDVSTFEADPNDPNHLARVVAINALSLVDGRFVGMPYWTV